jgi:hypothetical protein
MQAEDSMEKPVESIELDTEPQEEFEAYSGIEYSESDSESSLEGEDRIFYPEDDSPEAIKAAYGDALRYHFRKAMLDMSMITRDHIEPLFKHRDSTIEYLAFEMWSHIRKTQFTFEETAKQVEATRNFAKDMMAAAMKDKC